MFEIVKVVATLLILLKASIEDLRSREIDDRLWIVMVLIAIPLNVLEYLVKHFDVIFAFVQFVIMFAFANVMYYLLRFGGADCKALISLSIMFPTYPVLFPWVVKGLIFALSVLTNSVMFAPFMVLYFFVKNAVKGDFSKLMFIGYKVEIDKIPKFHNLLQFVKDGEVVYTLRGIEFDERIVEELKKAGVKYVWVTPALPFIVFMTFGFVFAVLIGDVIFILLSAVKS